MAKMAKNLAVNHLPQETLHAIQTWTAICKRDFRFAVCSFSLKIPDVKYFFLGLLITWDHKTEFTVYSAQFLTIFVEQNKTTISGSPNGHLFTRHNLKRFIDMQKQSSLYTHFKFRMMNLLPTNEQTPREFCLSTRNAPSKNSKGSEKFILSKRAD